MADENTQNSAGASTSSSSSSSASSSSSSSITTNGGNGDCSVHADAMAESDGKQKSDHVDKVIKNSDGSCSATARATSRSPGDPSAKTSVGNQ